MVDTRRSELAAAIRRAGRFLPVGKRSLLALKRVLAPAVTAPKLAYAEYGAMPDAYIVLGIACTYVSVDRP